MAEPIVPIETIVRDAHQTAEDDIKAGAQSACPYPEDTAAAARWRIEYCARELQLCVDVTT